MLEKDALVQISGSNFNIPGAEVVGGEIVVSWQGSSIMVCFPLK